MSKKIYGVTVGTPIKPQVLIERTEHAANIRKNTEDIRKLSKQLENQILLEETLYPVMFKSSIDHNGADLFVGRDIQIGDILLFKTIEEDGEFPADTGINIYYRGSYDGDGNYNFDEEYVKFVAGENTIVKVTDTMDYISIGGDTDVYKYVPFKEEYILEPLEEEVARLKEQLNSLPQNKVLWEGAAVMTADEIIELSETISNQQTGIVLVWSYYKDGAGANQWWNTTFIPKYCATHMLNSGIAIMLTSTPTNENMIAPKYIYITEDNKIKGYAGNSNIGLESSNSGAKINSGSFVLRRVIGV